MRCYTASNTQAQQQTKTRSLHCCCCNSPKISSENTIWICSRGNPGDFGLGIFIFSILAQFYSFCSFCSFLLISEHFPYFYSFCSFVMCSTTQGKNTSYLYNKLTYCTDCFVCTWKTRMYTYTAVLLPPVLLYTLLVFYY